MTKQSDQNWERIFELFKLEYEQSAERYENIYKAIWQIFYYMSILAAGILTFGSRSSSLPIEAIISITLTPLVFWFLAIYIPMNQYGEDAREHLKKIEKKINQISQKSWEITHYSFFGQSKPLWRVRNAIFVFGIIILISWVICIYQTSTNSIWKSTSETIELKLKSVEVTIPEPQTQEKLDSLSQQINSISSVIRDIKANSNQQ